MFLSCDVLAKHLSCEYVRTSADLKPQPQTQTLHQEALCAITDWDGDVTVLTSGSRNLVSGPQDPSTPKYFLCGVNRWR